MSVERRLDQLTTAVEALAAGLVTQNEQLQRGFQMLTAQLIQHEARMTTMEARMTGLEGQMTEVLGRLRIIGEQMATHTHDGTDE